MRPHQPRRRRTVAVLLFLICVEVASCCLLSSCAKPHVEKQKESTANAPSSSTAPQYPSPSASDDQEIQRAAIDALGDGEGSIIVLDPQCGRIRAVVNPRLAFEQSFPTGSTIKTFTALMALRLGLLDGESRSLCRGTFKRDGFQITCSHRKSGAPFTVDQALAYSCNVFFAGVSERLSPATFRSTLAGYGFGERTGLNAPEAQGSIAAGEWHIEDGVGEGRALLVTPVQLATAYAALFNGGHLYRTQLARADDFKVQERDRKSDV